MTSSNALAYRLIARIDDRSDEKGWTSLADLRPVSHYGRTLQKCLRRGWVELHPGNRRAVRLTETGRAIAERLRL